MKKNKTFDTLLSPNDYWEKKLNIKHETEFIRYKKLCRPLSKKEWRRLDGFYFITYKDWGAYILNIVRTLDVNELLEYSHYLENKARLESLNNGLTYNLFLPFFLSVLTPITSELIENFINSSFPENNAIYEPFIPIILMIICCLAWLPALKDMAKSSREEILRKEFFSDIKLIIVSRIDFLKTH